MDAPSRVGDLRLQELFDLLPERGHIGLSGRRFLLWDADAFGSLRKELIDTLGLPAARAILRRFGFANGYRDALTMKALFAFTDDREWWLSCPALQRHEGKVRPNVTRLKIDRDAGEFLMQVTWEGSYEAAQHARVLGACDEPSCWTLTGYASGFSTAVMGQEVFVVEQQCVACAADTCRVTGKTRQAWGDSADELAREYEVDVIAPSLERSDAQLKLRQRDRATHDPVGGPSDPAVERVGLISRSAAMERVLQLAAKVARVDTTVLVSGESGVGKERIARFIHDNSPRGNAPFSAVNCAALPESLLESELFGHEKGAFTGASTARSGLFQAASRGTLFLDEVGEMTPSTQAKVLRVLEERLVRPLGASAERPVDVRVVCATNRNLEQMVSDGSFREDLYYRLKVVSVVIPPLRARREDVLPLARAFLAAIAERYGLPARDLSAAVADALLSYAWPGNVRELRNAVEHALVVASDARKIEVSDLPPEIGARSAGERRDPFALEDGLPLLELERRYVLRTLEKNGGHRTRTAAELGIGANTLWRKLKRWAVDDGDERDDGAGSSP